MNIKISSDSTCDLSAQQIKELNIAISALIVVKDDKEFKDDGTITPSDIFAHVANGGSLCSTAALSYGFYQEHFEKYAKDYDAVVHISLGSNFSSSYQNACLAAGEFDNVYVVDSMNLSTGQGHIVLKACELAKNCTDINALVAEINAYAPKVEASFVLDQLAYMVKGGRCSAVAALGANLLGLKPCIEVKNGKMGVVKKYRGNYAKCLATYAKERLADREDIDRNTVFITYTTVSDDALAAVKDAVNTYGNFSTVYETQAGCTISCHCGPGTLGVLFVRK